LALAALAVGCRHEKPKPQAPSFDAARFIASTLQTSIADTDLGAMAAHRGRLPETRQFGAAMQREQGQLVAALTAMAKRKGVAVPTAVEEKKRALKDNLSILPGQVFDRGYSLAMLQDLNAMIPTFRAAASSGDAEVSAFAKQQLPIITAEQKSAAAVLSRLGGSPFGFVPQ
jgi:putative membrane protein